MKRFISSAGVAAIMMATIAVPSYAAIVTDENVAGGTWVHGVNNDHTQVVSEYFHNQSDHRASTVNGYDEYHCAQAHKGAWAKSHQRARKGHVDKAYYAVANCER